MTSIQSPTVRTLSAFLIAALLLCLPLSRVASADDVTSDYSRSVDFSTFQTFMWIKEPGCVDPCSKQAIVDGINFQLEAKGLYLVESDADLEVSVNIATGETYTLSSFYRDFPPDWDWHHYMGPGSTVKMTNMSKAETYKPGTLVVDLFDADKKQVIWWGVADKFVYDEALEGPKQIFKAFEEMFSGAQWWTTLR